MKYPVEDVLDDVKTALRNSKTAVLQALPGAGKTTVVPLALLDEPWLNGKKIIIIEPRRLAARAAANRMSSMLNQPAGKTVGYRTRFESRVSASTRIELVTDGIFTRMIQNDPELKGVGLVIFDEIHERSLNSDLGLALVLESQKVFNTALCILLMSATLDGKRYSAMLDHCPLIESAGKLFPVETNYITCSPRERIEASVCRAIARALRQDMGSMLVFLPGVGEIKRVESRLREEGIPEDVHITPLYGDLDKTAQDEAILPAKNGERKIVLATSIAETSLTIEGISVVIDSGFGRKPRFSAGTGMTRLETLRISRASADQRRGRAGRTSPGTCYRLWDESLNSSLSEFDQPEIMESDLSPLALELAEWNVTPADLRWIDPPPAAKYESATALLKELDALGQDGRISRLGSDMIKLGCHPRLASMILHSANLGALEEACGLAAIIEERDFLRSHDITRNADIELRLAMIASREDGRREQRPYREPEEASGHKVDQSAKRRVIETYEMFRRRAAPLRQDRATETNTEHPSAGTLLAFAYPDRIARRRSKQDLSYLLANGRGAAFREFEPLCQSEYLVIADINDSNRDATIRLAATLDIREIEEHHSELVKTIERFEWSDKDDCFIAATETCIGNIVINSKPLKAPSGDRIAEILLGTAVARGLDVFDWSSDATNIRNRIRFINQHDKTNNWPNVSDTALLENLYDWVGPFVKGMTKLSQLKKINLCECLLSMLDWKQRKLLDELAPERIAVPSGSKLKIDYSQTETPALEAKMQELFGAVEHPSVMRKAVPVTIKILSPAMRPIQVTANLPEFWKTSYHIVAKEMRGRYPRHYWPDDPLTAEPTTRSIKKRNS